MKQLSMVTAIILIVVATGILYVIPDMKKESDYVPKKMLRDYQLEIVGEHTIRMYDGDRLVGQFPYDEDTMNPTYLDNEILIDNQ